MQNQIYCPVNIEELADIQDIVIDVSLPVTEKKKSYRRQIKNPNLFRFDDIVVRTSYMNTGASFKDRIKQYLLSGQGMEIIG